jgi:hypothetical protein
MTPQHQGEEEIEHVASLERGTQTDNSLELILTGQLGKEVFADGEDTFWELQKGYRIDADCVVKKETFKKIHTECKPGEFHRTYCWNKKT